MTAGKVIPPHLLALIDEHAAAERRMLRAFAECLTGVTELLRSGAPPEPPTTTVGPETKGQRVLTMNKKEFAGRVGISVSKLEKMMQKGEVSYGKFGTRVVFTEDHALEVLKKFETKAVVRKQSRIKIT
jgi:hypothetical protein